MTLAGLRPGEKLYEEKLMAEEGLTKTENELIHIGKPIPFDTDEFLRQLERLAVVAYGNPEFVVVTNSDTVFRQHDLKTRLDKLKSDRQLDLWWFKEKIQPLLKGFSGAVVYADDCAPRRRKLVT